MASHRADRAKSVPGFRNLKCYAHALGGCCAEVNREHYVSKSILEIVNERFGVVNCFVRVKNLPFQTPDTLEEKGIRGLTARILCTVHNGLLSRFDSVGKAMFVAMDKMNECGLDLELPVVAAQIDGDALERWMLKTLYGGLYSGNFRTPSGESKKLVCPPAWWLEVLYNDAKLPPGYGLYFVYDRADLLASDPIVFKLGVVASPRGDVLGLRIHLFGFEFALLRGDPTNRIDEAQFRPEGFMDVRTGAHIGFSWKDGPCSTIVRVKSHGDVTCGRITDQKNAGPP